MSEYTSEGYNSQAKALEGPSLQLSDFPSKGYSGRKRKFTDEDKVKFYVLKAKTTVLLCQIHFTVEEPRDLIPCNVICTSNEGTHAEEDFIRETKKCIQKKVQRCNLNLEEISMTMLINYSPCFKCRQELEHYLTTLVESGTKVKFTLRVGKLYCDGFKEDEAERKLAFWKNDLEMQGVTMYLEAINVANELPIDIPKSKKKLQQQRDKKNKACFERIEMNTIAANKLLRSIPKDTRETHFIKKNGEQMILGELTVSAVTDRQRVPTTEIPLSTTRYVSENPEEKILQKATSLPQCWDSIRKHLLLLCVHVPSLRCLEQITSFLTDKRFPDENKRNKLVMYIANVPDPGLQRNGLIDWIKTLEEKEIHFCLQPLYAIPGKMSGLTAKRYAALCDQFKELQKEIEQTMSLVDHKASTSQSSQTAGELSPLCTPQSEGAHIEQGDDCTRS